MATLLTRYLACDGFGCPARFVRSGMTPLTVLRHDSRFAGWRARGRRNYCPQHRPWPGLAAWATTKAGA